MRSKCHLSITNNDRKLESFANESLGAAGVDGLGEHMGHPQPGSLSLFFRGRLGTPSGSTGSPPSSTSGASRQSSSDRDSGRNWGDVDRNHTSAWAGPIQEHRQEPGSTSPLGTARGSPILRVGAFSLYGMRATYMARFGTSIGWDLFQIFMILTATLAGVFSGEWRFAPRLARTLLVLSIICVSGATSLSAYANR